MKDMLVAVWNYRHFIVSSIRNDLRSRFARSKLGALWMVLQPLAQVAIYSIVLARVLGSRLPGATSEYAFPIYLMGGMIVWSLFVEIVQRCLTVFVDNSGLLKKIVFPRICLPIIIAGSALVNNILLIAMCLVVFAILGHYPGIYFLWIIPVVVLTIAFSLGLGLLLGIINVFVRDVAQVMNVVLQLWFWLTPVVYMPSILPPSFMRVIKLNPVYPLVRGAQNAVLFNTGPGWRSMFAVVGIACILLLVSMFLFRRASAEMVDVL